MTKPKHNEPRLIDRAFDDRGIQGNAKHVFLHMCRRGNASGLCYMTKKTLGDECGLSHSTISRSLKKLEEAGRIVALGVRPRTCVRQYSLHPGGHSDLAPKSIRHGSACQNEPQNPSRNQKENHVGDVESAGITARSKSAVQIGDATKRVVGSFSNRLDSALGGEGGVETLRAL